MSRNSAHKGRSMGSSSRSHTPFDFSVRSETIHVGQLKYNLKLTYLYLGNYYFKTYRTHKQIFSVSCEIAAIIEDFVRFRFDIDDSMLQTRTFQHCSNMGR
jgi:hypothetical protein